ncbi:MAG TPA: BON domain-containing protein [Gemmatimonadales bacterium]|nr:BON domain-containing protein [Gemmatimonadales bacterium]
MANRDRDYGSQGRENRGMEYRTDYGDRYDIGYGGGYGEYGGSRRGFDRPRDYLGHEYRSEGFGRGQEWDRDYGDYGRYGGDYGRGYGRDFDRDSERGASGRWSRDHESDFGRPGNYGRYGTSRDAGYGSGYGAQESYGAGFARDYDTWGNRGDYGVGQGYSPGYGGFAGTYGYQGWGGGYGGAYGSNFLERQGTHYGRGPRGYQRADARIEEDVNEMLTRDPDVDASDIEVKVQNGEVTLTGHVDSRDAKRRAEDLAEQCSGVREVHNQLRVKRGLMERLFGGGEDEHDREHDRDRDREQGRTAATGASSSRSSQQAH